MIADTPMEAVESHASSQLSHNYGSGGEKLEDNTGSFISEFWVCRDGFRVESVWVCQDAPSVLECRPHTLHCRRRPTTSSFKPKAKASTDGSG